jgi:hypothetical protein
VWPACAQARRISAWAGVLPTYDNVVNRQDKTSLNASPDAMITFSHGYERDENASINSIFSVHCDSILKRSCNTLPRRNIATQAAKLAFCSHRFGACMTTLLGAGRSGNLQTGDDNVERARRPAAMYTLHLYSLPGDAA